VYDAADEASSLILSKAVDDVSEALGFPTHYHYINATENPKRVEEQWRKYLVQQG
jgi:hypothetical protein